MRRIWRVCCACAASGQAATPPSRRVGEDVATLTPQLLDGVSAAVLAVMVPLVIADVTRGTGHFNLGQGIVGTAVGIGASVSTTYAGYLSDHLGSPIAFLGLAMVAILGFFTLWALMPETRPRPKPRLS
jgi:MFS family permease